MTNLVGAHRPRKVLLDDLEDVEGTLAAAFGESQRVQVDVSEVATQNTQGLQAHQQTV